MSGYCTDCGNQLCICDEMEFSERLTTQTTHQPSPFVTVRSTGGRLTFLEIHVDADGCVRFGGDIAAGPLVMTAAEWQELVARVDEIIGSNTDDRRSA